MIPFRFGPPHRQLYGVYHPAEPGRPKAAGLLLCNPFGQEAIRTHRMFRVLAERLARSGISVLRFDYFGTGDSAGDDAEGDLDTWRDNLLQAHHELKKRTLGAPISWLGVRLGATLAALAAEREPEAAEHLLLWEPLADGRAYLAELARHHRHALEKSYGLVPDQYQRAPTHEAVGFEMGALLVQQLKDLNADRLASAKARRATFVSGARSAAVQTLGTALRRNGCPTEEHVFEHGFDWASEEALNTALVPQEAIKLLASLVDPQT